MRWLRKPINVKSKKQKLTIWFRTKTYMGLCFDSNLQRCGFKNFAHNPQITFLQDLQKKLLLVSESSKVAATPPASALNSDFSMKYFFIYRWKNRLQHIYNIIPLTTCRFLCKALNGEAASLETQEADLWDRVSHIVSALMSQSAKQFIQRMKAICWKVGQPKLKWSLYLPYSPHLDVLSCYRRRKYIWQILRCGILCRRHRTSWLLRGGKFRKWLCGI